MKAIHDRPRAWGPCRPGHSRRGRTPREAEVTGGRPWPILGECFVRDGTGVAGPSGRMRTLAAMFMSAYVGSTPQLTTTSYLLCPVVRRSWASAVPGAGTYECQNGYFAAPISKIFVPHVGHVPSVAGHPFFIETCLAPLMSRCVLHFMQYPVAIQEAPSVIRADMLMRLAYEGLAYSKSSTIHYGQADRDSQADGPVGVQARGHCF